MTVVKPGKIICVGRNFAAHAREMGNDVPTEPLIFFKPISSLIGDGDTVVMPRISNKVEYESEIVIVMGSRAHKVSESDALRHVRGYTCANDITCRDLQKSDSQWWRAKGFDTFCPVGPSVVEGLDWRELEVIGRLNGIERQRGAARDMIFGVPRVIEFISHVLTLEAGDLILTGTPEGTMPLTPGDTLEVEIPGIGILHNNVAAESDA